MGLAASKAAATPPKKKLPVKLRASFANNTMRDKAKDAAFNARYAFDFWKFDMLSKQYVVTTTKPLSEAMYRALLGGEAGMVEVKNGNRFEEVFRAP